MSEIIQKLLDVLIQHRNDGFEVPAVRVPEEEYNEILTQTEFIVSSDDHLSDYKFEYNESVGLILGTEVIVDDEISKIVAEDVRGMWR